MELGTIQYNVEANTTDLDRASESIDEFADNATKAGVQVDAAGKKIEGASRQSAKYATATESATRTTKNFNGVMGQFGYQMQDAIVQLQMGANAGMVFAQQGSQLFSVFNPMLGLLAAVGGVLAGMLVPALLGAGASAEELTDQIKDLNKEFTNLMASQRQFLLDEETKKLKEYNEQLKEQQDTVTRLDRRYREIAATTKDQVATNVQLMGVGAQLTTTTENQITALQKLNKAKAELETTNQLIMKSDQTIAELNGKNIEFDKDRQKGVDSLIKSLQSQLNLLTLTDDKMADYIASQVEAEGKEKDMIKTLYLQIEAEKKKAEQQKESERIAEQAARTEKQRVDSIAKLNSQLAKEAALMGNSSKEAEILWSIKNGLLKVTQQEEAALIANAKAYDVAAEKQREYNALMEELNEYGFDKAFEDIPEKASKFSKDAVERINGAFAGAWAGLLDGSEDAFDGILNAFKQMLAELAHEALTKPIILNIQQSMSGTADTANQAGSAISSGGIWGAIAVAVVAGVGVWNKEQNARFKEMTAEYRQGNQSIGTILGEGNKKSESIAGAISSLESTAGDTLGVNNEMLVALLDIRTGIGGVAAGFARTMIGSGVSGIKTGSTNIWAENTGNGNASASLRMVRMMEKYDPFIGEIAGFFADFGGAIYGKISSAIISKKSKIIDEGIAISGTTLADILSTGAIEAFAYADVQTKKKVLGITTSNKVKTQQEALDEVLLAQFAGVFASAGDALSAAADVFGLDFSRYIDKLIVDPQKLSLKDLEGDALVAEIESFFSSTLDNWAGVLVGGTDILTQFQQVGEGAFETVIRLAGELNTFNKYAELLNLNFKATGVNAITASQSVAELMGGFDALSSSLSRYYAEFFTEEERAQNQIKMFTDELSKLGITTAPQTREAFRALIEAQDLTTESGRKMFSQLLGLTDVADAYLDSLDREKKAKDDLIDQSYSALQRSVDAQKKIIDSQMDVISTSLDAARSVYAALESSLDGMVINSNRTLGVNRRMAQSQLSGFLTGARGGVLPDLESLTDALSVISQPSENLFATLEDYAFDFARTAGIIKELQDITGGQITTEEKALAELESQSKYLDEMLGYAKSQIDALRGIDNSVLNLSVAMNNLAALLGIQFPSSEQLAQANVSSELVTQNEALRAKMDENSAKQQADNKANNEFMKASQIAITENTLQIRKILEKFDAIGMPPVREEA